MKKMHLAEILLIIVFLLVIVLGIPYAVTQVIKQTTENAVAPIKQANEAIREDVARLLHPTPTIVPDPITIIHEVKTLARLETIQYSVEKVIRLRLLK